MIYVCIYTFAYAYPYCVHINICKCIYIFVPKELHSINFFFQPIKGLNHEYSSTYKPKRKKKKNTVRVCLFKAHFHSITILALTLIILDLISQLFWALFCTVTVIHTVPWISLSRLIGWSLCDLVLGKNKKKPVAYTTHIRMQLWCWHYNHPTSALFVSSLAVERRL